MAISHLSIFVISFTCVLSYSDDLIDYYVNLIQNEIKRSQNFTLPSDSQSDKPFTNEYIEYGTFDNIVVGAGSAGGIVASRLSEDRFRNVLLIEAGGNETDFSKIPKMAGVLWFLEYNWDYYAIPQTTACLGMPKRQCAYPRGKVLGGSSGINALIYTRGCKKDYDNWCAQGNPGWCYKDVLGFFKKSENSEIDGDLFYHGFNGYLNVEYSKPLNTRQKRAFIDGNIELNRLFLDYNGRRQEGVGGNAIKYKKGRRCSTGAAFLENASHRPNLKILTHSHVAKILIDPKTKKAYGVLFAKNNKYYIARSRKDIVISAGTIGSPQLLMVSGIGPKLHLEELKIPVIKDLSVGENFQDHVGFGLLHFKTDFPEWGKSLRDNVIDYLNGVGEFTDTFNAKGIAFVRTNLTKTDDFPDLELLVLGSNSTSIYLKKLFNYDDETFKYGWPSEDLSRIFTIKLILMHPKSRGYVKLKSSDPFDYPIINPMLLSDPNFRDIDTIYEGIQLTLKLLDTKAFKKLGAKLYRVHLPACKEFKYLSKEYWYCHIRQVGTSIAHIVGTCKMGPNPLHGAVVDHRLRVHGVQNLRVADASIMPLVPSGHTNAASMMIGEKAAHMIREE